LIINVNLSLIQQITQIYFNISIFKSFFDLLVPLIAKEIKNKSVYE